MTKPTTRAYSRYSREAMTLFGLSIRQRRIERKLTLEALAERAGISRGLLQRIERGDMGCAIGAVFEVATIVGIPLFGADHAELAHRTATAEKTLTLLPHAARAAHTKVKDDF